MRRYIHFVDRYISTSAGQRLSHYLCHIMNKAGYPSFLVIDQKLHVPKEYEKFLGKYPLTNPDWTTPILLESEITDEDIVIYMEGKGNINPLMAKNVVRYFGYYPSKKQKGYWGGSRISGNELVFCMPFIRDEVEQYWDNGLTDINIITIPTIEPNLFKPMEKTIESAHYFGKGKRFYNNTENIHLPKDSFEIEPMRPSSRKGLANILNHTKDLYLFDPETAMAREGQLAGCRVFYLFDLTKIKELKDEIKSDPIQDITKDIQIAKQVVIVCNHFFGENK